MKLMAAVALQTGIAHAVRSRDLVVAAAHAAVAADFVGLVVDELAGDGRVGGLLGAHCERVLVWVMCMCMCVGDDV